MVVVAGGGPPPPYTARCPVPAEAVVIPEFVIPSSLLLVITSAQ